VLDPATGTVVAGPSHFPVRRRSAVSPSTWAGWRGHAERPGRSGERVQVLGWSGSDFGELRTIPAKALYIVR
jgi:hypothetical protein